MRSMRRQLVLWLLALLLAAGSIAAVGLYFRIRDEANLLFDYHLQQLAFSLRDQVLAQSAPLLPDELQYDFIVQIWSPNGEQIYLSRPHSALPNHARLGFETVATVEGAWRVFSVEMRDRVIQVAQPLKVRQALARQLALHVLLPFTLLLPVLGVLLWGIVGRGLKPLDRMARDVANRSASALTPLTQAGLPSEIAPLVGALNDLLARLEHSIEAQRAFVADAAHELRSPLTAVQLQVQIAERAKTDDERKAAFAQLKEGITRAIHLVQQLLTLARQNPEVTTHQLEPIDLSQIAKQVIGQQAPMAHAKRIDLGMSRDEPIVIEGDAEALQTLLGNLIDNAIRYISTGGHIDVAVALESGRPVISVTDNGPGIPAEERRRVLDRFYRRDGSVTVGSGLGLAIVKNIADRHGAELRLDAGPNGIGLKVSVCFPTPAKGVRQLAATVRRNGEKDKGFYKPTAEK